MRWVVIITMEPPKQNARTTDAKLFLSFGLGR